MPILFDSKTDTNADTLSHYRTFPPHTHCHALPSSRMAISDIFFREADFLFISIHQTPPSHKFPPFHPKQKEQSLLVLPSVHTILNFATEFFEMFTKLQSEHPQKVFQVFQVFRVFQVFHFTFGPQNRPVLVQIRTKPTNS